MGASAFPMIYDLNLAVIASTAGIAILAAIYLWSEDTADDAGPGNCSSSCSAVSDPQ